MRFPRRSTRTRPVLRLRSPRPAFGPLIGRWGVVVLAALLFAPIAFAEIVITDHRPDLPLVLNQAEDYVLRNVRIAGLTDMAALTLQGAIRSLKIENGKFGNVVAGPGGKAAAMEAVNASVGNMTVTDSAFYDAENQLVSLRDGTFGTVTFMHCTFKASEAFLKRLYAANGYRSTPPTTEFYNIDRLELLDNEFANTTIVIHPSVKTVILRGDITKLMIESPETQVYRLEPGQDPKLIKSPGELPPATFAGVFVDPNADNDDDAAPLP